MKKFVTAVIAVLSIAMICALVLAACADDALPLPEEESLSAV